jgi:hypothetical protein
VAGQVQRYAPAQLLDHCVLIAMLASHTRPFLTWASRTPWLSADVARPVLPLLWPSLGLLGLFLYLAGGSWCLLAVPCGLCCAQLPHFFVGLHGSLGPCKDTRGPSLLSHNACSHRHRGAVLGHENE